MLEKINGAKYWALIGAALLLSACANSNTGAVPETPTDPVVDTQEDVISQPTEDVTTEPMMEDPDTQSSLDAAADAALVYFGYDRYDLSSDARSGLQAQASWLQAHSSVKVTVEGHCDERGTREYNLALGDRRANSVKNYLVALGVDPSRIHTVSYGKERPVVTGTGESSWSMNRRGYTRVN
ncbi:MAG: peptidoglycan-associated lipoprotein [Alphaproteobacteria bacterium]|nr:MAG: peptidoglycan-associated lipoprotein [Alphaproteobacteria bacterium]